MNAIGMHRHYDLINSGLTRWWLDGINGRCSGKQEKPVQAPDRYSLSVGNGQADAGRDGRTCCARPNSQERFVTRKIIFSISN